MNEAIEHRYVQWDEFLARWTLDDMHALTLEQYCAPDSEDTLSNWLLHRTPGLGDFKEGPLSMGIRQHAHGQTKPKNKYNSYDERYVWLNMLGDSAGKAFESLKQGMIEAVEAGRSGQLERLDALMRQPGALMRKIAFLYQGREHPCLLPIYSMEHLRAAFGAEAPNKVSALNRELLALQGDRPLFGYADHLWQVACERLNATSDAEKTLALFASDARLAKSLRSSEERQLFHRLAQAIHRHGLDWWTVRLDQGASTRCGRKEGIGHGHTSVLMRVEPRLNKGMLLGLGGRDTWEPLSEELVIRAEQNDFAQHFLAQYPADRPGCWPVDYLNSSGEAFEAPTEEVKIMSFKSPALNQILFGPPGTGKTYATIYEALLILEPQLLSDPNLSRADLVRAFEGYVAKGQIVFCTFHQSFSYEDFVEGLRASSLDGQLHYQVEPGLFKRLCERASQGRTAEHDPFDQTLVKLQERLEENDGRLIMHTSRGKEFAVEYSGGNTFLIFPQSNESLLNGYTGNLDLVRRLYQTGSKEGIYNPSYVSGMLTYLHKEFGLPPYQSPIVEVDTKEKFVLIIDEINRGNVSRIFGELITLVEESKRADAPEALSVVLPYSKERFSVPGNVHLVGTMNTADRSLAGLDIALRRRFTFKEMPPQPELLDEVLVAGVNIGQLLRVMNQRIEVLLDRDHCLGHAYFMPLLGDPSLDRLELIFRNQVLPLLQEYFFEDWQRIQWVLNDHRKEVADCFVYQRKRDVQALFGDQVSVSAHNLPWRINAQAFVRPEAYQGIIGHQAMLVVQSDLVEAATI